MRKCVREKERKREREILVCIHNPTGVDSWCERECRLAEISEVF